MMSSKSSRVRHRKSILSLALPSLRPETPSVPEAMDPEPDTPRSETSSGTADLPCVTGQEKKAKRRKSRLGLFTSFLPSLTSKSADHVPSVQRKPLPPTYHNSPGQPNPTLYDERTLQLMTTDDQPPPNYVDPPLAAPPIPPLLDHHVDSEPDAHTAHLPTMLKKVRKTHPVQQEQQLPPVPPQQHAPQIPPVPSVTETEASPPRLRKSRARASTNSVEMLSSDHRQPDHRQQTEHRQQTNRLQPRRTSPFPEPRGRSSSAQPPTNRNNQLGSPRVISNPGELRPESRQSSNGSPPRGSDRGKLRRSWLPGGRSRSNSQDLGRGPTAPAWIMSTDSSAEYNTSFLINGEKVPEIWDENGNIYIFLCAPGGGLGPSFKVPAFILGSSRVFGDMIQADMAAGAMGRDRSFNGRDNLSVHDARRQITPPASAASGAEGPGEANVYLPFIQPSGAHDLQRLIAVRNLLAFLTGQPLVGTKEHSTVFAAFLQIAALLREFEFGNYDGSSFGEPVDLAFGFYMGHLALADVRHSREKTIEALILGEQMKSPELYNEAFAHAVGKYTAILDVKSPLFQNVSVSTRNRLERAHIDLLNRQSNVNNRLEAFDFPALFAGIASSTSHEEYKNVRFKEWRISFGKMRSFVLGYYKNLFGNWPPKARSKKNQFSESGLNRQCLKILYSDLCALYDLLVDRESLTPRVIDQAPDDILEASVEPRISVLRRMLTEYDQSSPPVLPPIPYDVPKFPSMTAIREDYNELPAARQARFDKSIQPHEYLLIMLKSRNIDIDQLDIQFLAAFKEFEEKETKGCSPQDLVDQRIGCWLFLYAVLQCLPMLVVDAPGLKFTEGVEYFLCEPPQGNHPWMDDAGEVRKVWYEVSGGQNIVELSADVVMFSVEATYHRSHCWQAAKLWEASGPTAMPPSQEMGMSPLEPPRPGFQDPDASAPSPRMTAEGPASSPGSPALLPYHPPRNASLGGPGSPALTPHHHPPRNSSFGTAAAAATAGPATGRQGGHSYRSSVVMGLEPLQLPEWGAQGEERFSRQGGGGGGGSRPVSGAVGPPHHHQQHHHHHHGGVVPRSVSASNLVQLAAAQDAGPGPKSGLNPGHGGGGGGRKASGSTFDDILKGMGEKDKGGKKKRFPF